MLAMDWMSLEASHAQVVLDIEGNIEMANARKIQWVNANTYDKVAIHHAIDCDDNLNIYCDTKMSVFTPLTEYYTNVAGGKILRLNQPIQPMGTQN